MSYPETKDVEIPEEIVERWQKIVDIMAEVIDVPAGLIMRIKPPEIEVFKSSKSEENPYEVGEKEDLAGLYCEKVIKSKDKLLVPHAQKDEKWKNNPEVELGMISYLGFPLEWPDGDVFGTICVPDSEENRYGEKYEDLMRRFKNQIEAHLKLLRQNREFELQIEKREEAEEREKFLHSLLRHNLKDKANIIRGYHELLQDFDLPKGAETYLEKADDAVADSVEMIKKVRTFLETGRRGEAGEISVNSAIDTAVNRNKAQASERGIQVKFERPDCTVQGGKLLEELFSNLVENAVRHSGCDRVRISGREENDGCVISVEDDGKGIPNDIKNKIFKIGYKKGKNAGSGLGLYLVKEIAESYNGSTEVKDSELGGARFDIHLRKTKNLNNNLKIGPQIHPLSSTASATLLTAIM